MANKIEMTGSGMDLKKEPRDMRADAFSGGMIEVVGSEASLSRTTDQMGVFNKHVREDGTVSMTGNKMDFDRTPRPGWQSYETPISHNSETPQQAVSNYPRSGKR